MAIVLALLIVGWLVAFALGNQAGFENSQPAKPAAPAQAETTETAKTYTKPASASQATVTFQRTRYRQLSFHQKALMNFKVHQRFLHS